MSYPAPDKVSTRPTFLRAAASFATLFYMNSIDFAVNDIAKRMRENTPCKDIPAALAILSAQLEAELVSAEAGTSDHITGVVTPTVINAIGVSYVLPTILPPGSSGNGTTGYAVVERNYETGEITPIGIVGFNWSYPVGGPAQFDGWVTPPLAYSGAGTLELQFFSGLGGADVTMDFPVVALNGFLPGWENDAFPECDWGNYANLPIFQVVPPDDPNYNSPMAPFIFDARNVLANHSLALNRLLFKGDK